MASRKAPPPVVTPEGVRASAGGAPIALDSAGWFAWLAGVDAFVFETPAGSYTARRERRGDGGRYWRAAKKRGGRLRRAYLGLAEQLTGERLMAAAGLLLGDGPPAGGATRARSWPIPSAPPHDAARPRLLLRLDAGAGKALTVVSGPAGSGKTALLAAWARRLRRRGVAVAWVGLTPRLSAPERLWPALLEACAAAAGAPRPAPPSGRDGGASPAEGLADALAGLRGPLVLILDGYEAARDPAVHAALGALLGAAPRLQLVIGARGRPPLPLASLRARDDLLEIQPAELDCTPEEATALLARTLGRAPTAEELTHLLAQSEGWVAGLRLAAMALRDGAGALTPAAAADGAHPYLADYLLAEVVAPLSPDLQAALRDAAPLGTLSVELFAAATGRTPQAAAAALGELARAGAMVAPLDLAGRAYRVHPQLAAALVADEARREPGRLHQVRAGAARWHAAAGEPDRAIELALAAGDHELAAGLLAAHGTAQLLLGRVGAVRGWLARLPAAARQGDPRLTLLSAWEATLSGRPDLARAHAEAALAMAPRLAAEARASVEGEALAALAIAALAEHDWAAMARHAEAAALALPPSNTYLHGLLARLRALGRSDGAAPPGESPLGALAQAAAAAEIGQEVALAVAAHTQAADLARVRGELQAAALGYRRALRLGDAAGRPPAAALALIGLGALAYERDELGEAARLLRDGLALAEQGGLVATVGDGLYLLGRALLAGGGADEAAAAAARLQALDLGVGLPAGLRARAAALEVELALASDDAGGLGAHMPALLAGAADGADTALLIPAARALLRRGEAGRALELAAAARARAEGLAGGAPDPRARAAEALALSATGDERAALALLGPALRRAEREGWARALLDAGPPVAPLLHGLAASGVAPAFARGLAARLGGTPPDGPPLVEALTPREHEILGLLAAGEPLAAIAEALGLGASTVKWHAANLYGKLGVGSRAQAVARARILNLL